MFGNFTDRILNTFDTLTGKGLLSEDDVTKALREIRVAMLEADVPLAVAKDFVENIKEKAVGEKILKSIKPGDMVVKIVRDSLADLLGKNLSPNLFDLSFKGSPSVFLLLGLQGSGKTTTAGKLSLLLKNDKKRVLLSSLDIYRPAAIEQLNQIAKSVEIDYMDNNPKEKLEMLVKNSFLTAKQMSHDVIIFDTAGRTTLNETLMQEIKNIQNITNPNETLLVADSMIGQESVNVAKAFQSYVNLTGIILTRVDGDSKGGAALSMTVSTGKPIKFLGVGEKISNLEKFSADRVADRILDMGDIVGIVEKAEKELDEEEAKKMANKLSKGTFDLDDFQKQLSQMKKLGGIKGILSLMPGIRKAREALEKSNLEDKTFIRMGAIISSMTKKEKSNPSIINGSRKRRIALGSGVEIQDVNRLLKQFKNMQLMMKKISKHGMDGMEKMLSNNMGTNKLGNMLNNLNRK
ncbi:MAG: Signal recognition particle protein [Alphaproteobacteria bacterium MarineAlpha9_Bin4]|nr:signal recognition particle protein [Pelagibacterales bacterium]PPR26699.1 MAG: Signal recognition particle protein [Alphaproteobacteria bacterium MarineAlpha9_Bin4]|tara:strand:+ start:114 stop:1505 length:1392 start_codon:yes stop_codon:yes gene_type:complete